MQPTTTTIKEFIEQLGSDSPAPGGGSACALSGALGVSLITMVANLTIGKPQYAEFEELNQLAIIEGNRISTELLDLVEKDSVAYLNLLEAYKLPRDTAEEREIRSAKVLEATIIATKTPLSIMEASLKALFLCKSLVGKSNANASSDLGVSAQKLLASINGAWLNVLINLGGIKNTDRVLFYQHKGQEIVDTAKVEAEFIYDSVKDSLLKD